ncbi:MAG TPA: L,D-transpeptidase [Bacteroidota bacterium]|nr:L,D-transpeptidase [Bacteroidota bacterium]
MIKAFLRRTNFLLLILVLCQYLESHSQPHEEYRIVIKKSEFLLELHQSDSLVRKFNIAVGKHAGDKQRVGDYRTPEGEFHISQIQDSRDWVHDFGDGKGSIAGAYGPWFLRLDTGAGKTKSGKWWKGIGIHGTHAPASIGTMATEGCIRMKNEDLEEMKKLVRIGTPVRILP